jgi:putative spermidine/putrescine transport system substrate-binding protein
MRRTRSLAAVTMTGLMIVAAACGSDEKESTATEAAKPAASEAPAAPAPAPAPAAPASEAPAPPASEAAPAPADGDFEGEVNVVAWAGYVERGETDPAVDWVTGFEAETGCKVNVKTGNSSDEMVQLMNTGEYDTVSASGDATLRLIAGDQVIPIDLDRVPNYADIFEGLKNKPWNSVDGVAYGIPHGRGANLLMWNTDEFPDGFDSWSVMWEADSPAKGKVSVYDSPIYIADAALYLMASQPELGITNPYAMDQTQFDAAIALLESQKDIAGQYWALFTDQQTAFEAGSMTAGTTWQIIANLALGNDAKVAVTKPKEGATGWSDTWMISSQAKNPNCAYAWVNHIASPQANAGVAEWFGEAPSNAKSCALTGNPDHCDIFHAEDESYWTDVWYWTVAQKECLDGRDVECVDYAAWVKAWSELRAG